MNNPLALKAKRPGWCGHTCRGLITTRMSRRKSWGSVVFGAVDTGALVHTWCATSCWCRRPRRSPHARQPGGVLMKLKP